jgi:hypothetical protein
MARFSPAVKFARSPESRYNPRSRSEQILTGEEANMTSTLQAHFDGRVIIPDEPVDLPVDEKLEIDIRIPYVSRKSSTDAEREAAWRSFLSRTAQGVGIPDEALRREAMYEDED